ncbi:transporter substrate-binding domain-containing protein [Microvirga sp. 17 mud 1-3]|uniref:transporter substrate-binding domain-containing protein n=1 Tax=Microvirga sp. 17 mud 1-3 TaxID=2082949 RepID=UPI000D6B4BA2|nr:transporter substrate-binding domain-containing protein [Microvirga sp. 17 mud 1-3]AWM86246.1 amino acid ABC transporter [Microvirga sp. 17 mud 1-3]
MIVLSFGRRLTAMAGLFFWLAATPATAQDTSQPKAPDSPTIRIAIEGAYPPFNYMENNELQGFEVDLGKALCDVMKADCVFVQHEWEGIQRGLLNREYDAVMSSLEITEKRQKRLAFSKPYYRIPAIFIAPKESSLNGVTPSALAGRKIGATDRSDHLDYLRQNYKGAEIIPYSTPVEANLDLLVGRIDAVFGDKRALAEFLKSREGECCRILGPAPADPPYRRQFYGVGMRKEDTALKARFDEAIDKVMADGTYDRIRAKYFPFDIK